MSTWHRHRNEKQHPKNWGRLFFALIVGALLASCQRETPLPVTATPLILIPSATFTPTLTGTPSPSTNQQAEGTPSQATEPTLAIPLTATLTPTICQPPDGWVEYIVRPGDTLFSLANKTNTTIEAIMQANCLDSNLIVAGKPIALPSIPPAPPPLPTRSLPRPTSACDVPFVCSIPGPALTLATGGGNDADFTPCEFHLQSPWLDTNVPAATQALQVKIGQRLFIYACDFPASITSATINLSDGSVQSAPIYTTHPNPDLKMGNASAVIAWATLPTHPTGNYILVVGDENNNLAPPLNFTITMPASSDQFILVFPATGVPGDSFQVYYVNFPLNESPTFQLYGEDQPVVGAPHTLSLRGQWQVHINHPLVPASGTGWAESSLSMPAQLSPAAYAVTLADWSTFYTFWLR